MKRIVSVLMVLGSMGYAFTASAAGTLATTQINNTASATFTVGGEDITESSPIVSFRVDELLDVTVVGGRTKLVGSSVLAPGEEGVDDINQTLRFDVQNTGNGTEDFQIDVDQLIAIGDQFDPADPSSPTFDLYIDLDGDGIPDDGEEAILPGEFLRLAPDQIVQLIVVYNIPAGQASGDEAFVDLTATSRTVLDNRGAAQQVAGDVYLGEGDLVDPANAGAGSVDAIVGSTTAQETDRDIYLVNTLTIDLLKEAEKVASGTNSPDATLGLLGSPGVYEVPGDTIVYRLTFTMSGDGELDDLFIRDAIPHKTEAGIVTELVEYQINSIKVSKDGGPLVAMTDESLDTDGGRVYTPTTGENAGKRIVEISVASLLSIPDGQPDLVATTSPLVSHAIVVEFTVVIP